MNSETNKLAIDLKGQIETIISKQLCLNNTQLKDLRYLKTYTVDDRDTFEVDDAISLDQSEGISTIWVHISSPTEYINLMS